jgi:hypothetical protein
MALFPASARQTMPESQQHDEIANPTSLFCLSMATIEKVITKKGVKGLY